MSWCPPNPPGVCVCTFSSAFSSPFEPELLSAYVVELVVARIVRIAAAPTNKDNNFVFLLIIILLRKEYYICNLRKRILILFPIKFKTFVATTTTNEKSILTPVPNPGPIAMRTN